MLSFLSVHVLSGVHTPESEVYVHLHVYLRLFTCLYPITKATKYMEIHRSQTHLYRSIALNACGEPSVRSFPRGREA